jgi:hypothetical protein
MHQEGVSVKNRTRYLFFPLHFLGFHIILHTPGVWQPVAKLDALNVALTPGARCSSKELSCVRESPSSLGEWSCCLLFDCCGGARSRGVFAKLLGSCLDMLGVFEEK